jgi:hypothetical protein
MVRIFLIASIVLSIGSAAVAFLTKGSLRDLQNHQDVLVKQAKSTVIDLGKTTDALEKTKEELSASTKLADDRQTEIGGLNKQLASAKDDLSKAKQEKADADKKFSDAEATVEKAKKDLEKVVGLEKELADLKASSVEAVAVKEREIERLKGEVAAVQKKQDTGKAVRPGGGGAAMDLVGGGGGVGGKTERKVESRPAPRSGTVVSYDPSWNFAVISMGDRSGVTPETVLYAMRGETTVSKLKVSKVYADQAVVFPEEVTLTKAPEKNRSKDSEKGTIKLNLFDQKARASSLPNAVRAGDKVVFASGQDKKDERAAAVAEAKASSATVPPAAPAKKAEAADPLLAIPGLPGLLGDEKPAEKPAPADSKDAVPDPFKLNFN